ncbi:hypothetical protein MKW92_002450 [Papaver armeniacum]|nr:hypothetical protein MKW92_002450 [Papaver armeniacum]
MMDSFSMFVADNFYRRDLKSAAFASLSAVHRSILRIFLMNFVGGDLGIVGLANAKTVSVQAGKRFKFCSRNYYD